MKKITKEELKEILEQHKLWLRSDGKECKRADLSSVNLTDADLTRANLRFAVLTRANLTGVNLYGADLIGASLTDADLTRVNLSDANLTRANLTHANLSGVDLSDADLAGADLTCANLIGADLTGANLYCVNLTHANLSSADLTRADLAGADLSDADLTDADLTDASLTLATLTDTIFNKKEQCRKGIVLTEPNVGYKKASGGKIITLEIPVGAKVFSINNNKRRTNKVKVIDMQGETELSSCYDNKFKYHVGDEIEIEDFDERYYVECSTGIHFFLTREEAEKYFD